MSGKARSAPAGTGRGGVRALGPAMERAKGQSGVTLVELITVLLISGAVLLGLGYVFGLNYGLWMRGQERMILDTAGSRALEQIASAAGHAANLEVSGEGALRLGFAPAPSSKEVATDTVFSLRDGTLWRDGRAIFPEPGDSAMGVAAFEPTVAVEEGTGVRLLQVRLALYVASGPGAPAETLFFQSEAHARNAGLGLEIAGNPVADAGSSGGIGGRSAADGPISDGARF